MNYYLARDGKTYGPYPQEFIPAMVQQGQLTPDDLLCPEGGSDWTPLSQLPALMTPAAGAAPAAAAPAAGGLRMSSSHSQPTAAATPSITYTPAPQQKSSAMAKAGGLWGVLKLVGYGVVAVLVLGGLVTGFLASQRDKKEIAKLHSLPGWSAFDKANQQIDSESSNDGFGNTSEATQVSKALATMLEGVQREAFKVERTPRYRGRSKLGRINSAMNSATAGTGHFQTFVELRKDRVVVLVHIPEFKRYKGESREAITEMCWEGSLAMFAQMQKMTESPESLTSLLSAAGMTNPAARATTPGRAVPGRSGTRSSTNRSPAAAVAARPEPKFLKDLPIVVGVRGKSDYECVFVGTINTPSETPPAPTRKNVPSHQLLVQWFGEDRPQ